MEEAEFEEELMECEEIVDSKCSKCGAKLIFIGIKGQDYSNLECFNCEVKVA